MAKRKITVSPRQRDRSRSQATLERLGINKPAYRAKIDLCRIRPWRFRELTDDQLKRAYDSIGKLSSMRKRDPIREALGMFVAALRSQRHVPRGGQSARGADADAKHAEEKILRMQRNAGCAVPAREMVARDMEETKKYSAADIDAVRRGKRRPTLRGARRRR